MTDHLIFRYPALDSGILLKRYKRFFADIQLDTGEVITAHCPNTGPMTGVCTIGNPVMVSKSHNPKRKLAYTWELIQVHDTLQPTWVGVNTLLPNQITKLALAQHLFPSLGNYQQINSEVPYGADKKSRIDFLLTGNDTDKPIYVEVKNTTWTDGSIAVFPDTETTRGQKHLRELMASLPQYRSVMLYFINRGDCDRFAPGDTVDPKYGLLLRQAMAMGLEVLPCIFEVTPVGVSYRGLADCAFSQLSFLA